MSAIIYIVTLVALLVANGTLTHRKQAQKDSTTP